MTASPASPRDHRGTDRASSCHRPLSAMATSESVFQAPEVGSAPISAKRHAVPREVRTLLTVISCPDCSVPAEITERFSLPSTDGPVNHVALCCTAGHHFRMAVDMLSAQAQEQLAAQETRTKARAFQLCVQPAEPGRVLGQPQQQQGGSPALVPVLLPGAGSGPLPHDPVRRLEASGWVSKHGPQYPARKSEYGAVLPRGTFHISSAAGIARRNSGTHARPSPNGPIC